MKASIGQRVYGSFGLLVVAVAILGGAHITASNQFARQVEASLERSFAITTAFFKLRMNHQQMMGLLSSVREGQALEALGELDARKQGFENWLAVLRGRGYPPERLREVEEGFLEAIRLGQALATAAAGARQEEARALSAQLQENARLMEQRLEDLAKVEVEQGLVSFETTRRNYLGGSWGFRAGVAACTAMALLLAFGLRRSLVRPLRELTRVARDISHNGDLTLNVPVRTGGEVGQLAEAFGEMVERLRSIHQALHASSDTLVESVAYMRQSADRQQVAVSNQSVALQQTRVTAEELRQTSSMASQRAEAVLKVAEHADTLGRKGEDTIARSIEGLADLQAQVRRIAERIRDLGESTQQIGAITRTVKDLADQSNMLALNAAIEAVRSGEQGRGFGVVAREIRSLADQSIQATIRVREILDAVAGAVAETVRITHEGAESMQEGLEQVRATGESLRELSAIIRDNAKAVRQIALAVSQQDAGVVLIFEAVNKLSSMMEDTEHQLDQTRNAAVSLEEVSRRVTDMVMRYRT